MVYASFVKTYSPNPFDKKEILRYAGVKGQLPEIDGILDECIKEAENRLSYRVCYNEFDISVSEECLDFGFLKTNSKDLRKNLKNSKSVIVFAATIGIELDRLIVKYSSVSPVKALLFQAIGAERIEMLCDKFNREVKEEKEKLGKTTAPRFSAGYGDFPLECQRDIFLALNPPSKIGVTLNKSLLMSPSKSVTAIIGIS